MKKVYLDMTQEKNCVSVFLKDTEVIPAGTTIYSMSVNDKNSEYQRFADEYDIRFIFDDNVPVIDFYTIPCVAIIAADSYGGYIGTVGSCDFDGAPICYIDEYRNCFFVAENFGKFIEKADSWKNKITIV